MKIVLLDAATLGKDIELQSIQNLGEFTSYETTNLQQTLERCIEAEVVITNKVVFNKELLNNLPNLKLICVAATGMNNIDLVSAKECGIEVRNVKGYSTKSVVQHTFSMLFYLLSSSAYYDQYVKSSNWSKSPIFTNLDKPFNEIAGKTWGIIGLGEIGKNVADIAESFGSQVVYYSTSGKNINNKYQSTSLDDLLSKSDIITIHAPLNPNTLNLLNSKNLGLIKQGAVLLNLGRGGIVNELDIIKFIKNKNFFFGTDVLENEPMSKKSTFNQVLSSENLYITPHIAWASIEARIKLIRLICKNITTYQKTTL